MLDGKKLDESDLSRVLEISDSLRLGSSPLLKALYQGARFDGWNGFETIPPPVGWQQTGAGVYVTPGIQTKKLSSIARQAQQWLWPLRIPRGELTLLQGDPGIGKSYVMGRVIADLTTGKSLPGMTTGIPPIRVLIACEDNPTTVVRPRYEDLGADLDRIEIVTGFWTGQGTEARFTLDKITELEATIQRLNPDLVLIDPVASFTGGIDVNRANETRAILDPLVGLGAKYNLAIVCNMHCNKADVKALYKGAGSVQLAGTARSVLFVERDPENDEERVLVQVKTNVGPEAPSLNFRICETAVTHGTKIRFVTVAEWIEGKEGKWKPNQLLDGGQVSSGATSKREIAKALLLGLLHTGPRPTSDLETIASELGVTKRTLERARKDLEVKPISMNLDNGQSVKAVCLPGKETRQGSGDDQDKRLDRIEAAVTAISQRIEIGGGWRTGGPPHRHGFWPGER